MRTRIGSARRRKVKRWFKEAKGNRGGRSKLLRTVKETVVRSRAYAYRDRKTRKRAFRRLWIVRINAAVRPHGLMYSTFMHGLKLAGVELDRKSLSELAINEPAVFEEIVAVAKEGLASKQAA